LKARCPALEFPVVKLRAPALVELRVDKQMTSARPRSCYGTVQPMCSVRRRPLLFGWALMLSAVGCMSSAPDQDEALEDRPSPIVGLTSGASCASTTSLTYLTFGQPFMSAYCLGCHTISMTGNARRAPLDRNFDQLEWIRALAPLIDQQAGAGPAAVHAVMPPDGVSQPSLAQRQELSSWLACGAPK
jgi:uncharacterized membrane protein